MAENGIFGEIKKLLEDSNQLIRLNMIHLECKMKGETPEGDISDEMAMEGLALARSMNSAAMMRVETVHNILKEQMSQK